MPARRVRRVCAAIKLPSGRTAVPSQPGGRAPPPQPKTGPNGRGCPGLASGDTPHPSVVPHRRREGLSSGAGHKHCPTAAPHRPPPAPPSSSCRARNGPGPRAPAPAPTAEPVGGDVLQHGEGDAEEGDEEVAEGQGADEDVGDGPHGFAAGHHVEHQAVAEERQGEDEHADEDEGHLGAPRQLWDVDQRL